MFAIDDVITGVLVSVIAVAGRRLVIAAGDFRNRKYADDMDLARWLDTERLTRTLPDVPDATAGQLAATLTDFYDDQICALVARLESADLPLLTQIRRELRAGRQVKALLRHLAWWLFASHDGAAEVTERELIGQTAEFLRSSFESVDDAQDAAQEFVMFCHGRMWIFTDVGTTAADETLYAFTHRTFLEYFAAAYLAYDCDTPGDLAGVLAPHLIRDEWPVVAELAIQIKDRASSDRRGNHGADQHGRPAHPGELHEAGGFDPVHRAADFVVGSHANGLFLGDCSAAGNFPRPRPSATWQRSASTWLNIQDCPGSARTVRPSSAPSSTCWSDPAPPRRG
jgi:hypothetical protein